MAAEQSIRQHIEAEREHLFAFMALIQAVAESLHPERDVSQRAAPRLVYSGLEEIAGRLEEIGEDAEGGAPSTMA